MRLTLKDTPFEVTAPPAVSIPTLGDLCGGGALRNAWLRYWILDPVQGLLNWLTHNGLALLPSRLCSACGGVLGTLSRKRFARRPFAKRIAQNLLRLRPDAARDPAVREKLLAGWWSNVGSVLAEFSIVDRLWREQRLEIVGFEHLAAAQKTGRPLIFPSVHLGVWELMGVNFQRGFDRPSIGVYEPEPNRFVNRLVYRMRRRYGGYIFPPGQRTAVRLMKLITGGQANLIMFIDEVREKQVHMPLFGRDLPDRGNVVNVLKLQRASNAIMLPVYLLRMPKGRYRMTVLPPMDLARSDDARADLAANMRKLDAIFDPIVHQHIDQWYMLTELRLPKRKK